MLKEKLAKVVKRRQGENIKLSPPNSEQQVIDCFLAINSSISKDVLELYNNFGGMTDGDMDESLLSIWTLEEIKKKNSSAPEFIYFADFLIDSHRYAFKYEDVNISSVYSDWETSDFVKVADSV